MIKLKKVTKENYWDIVDLAVAKDQTRFVTSNAISLGQAYVQPELIPYAVYLGDTPIGFTMHCIDTDDNEYWLYRMMIDQRYQGKGYGKTVINALLDKIKQDKLRNKIYLGVHLQASAAVHVYQNMGFEFNGQVFGKEHIMVLHYGLKL